MNKEPYSFEQVLFEIERYRDDKISVPGIAKLLGVKSPTLNARFRREKRFPSVEGKRGFIPYGLALDLAMKHEYAIRKYPTVEEVSRMTGIRPETIKARCVKGVDGREVDCRLDLTKRLRINPNSVSMIRSAVIKRTSRAQEYSLLPEVAVRRVERKRYDYVEEPFLAKSKQAFKLDGGWADWVEPEEVNNYYYVEEPFLVNEETTHKSTPIFPVDLIFAEWIIPKHILYPPVEKRECVEQRQVLKPPQRMADEHLSHLNYDSQTLPRLRDCLRGRWIKFAGRLGVIQGYVTDGKGEIDFYRPQIKVQFPGEREEKFQHLNLIVRAG